MADEIPIQSAGDDPLAAERARLQEATRLLEAERARLWAETEAARERRRGDDDDEPERSRGRHAGDDDDAPRRRRRRRGLLAALMSVDPELRDWWCANRPSRVVGSFLRDTPDAEIDESARWPERSVCTR